MLIIKVIQGNKEATFKSSNSAAMNKLVDAFTVGKRLFNPAERFVMEVYYMSCEKPVMLDFAYDWSGVQTIYNNYYADKYKPKIIEAIKADPLF